MPNETATNANSDRFTKLKRSILFGVLLIVGIIAWHIYEYFYYDKSHAATPETTTEHEIFELTEQLFAEELKHPPFLGKVNFQGKTKSYAQDDRAAQPLLELHADVATDPTSTIYLLKRLYDNYHLDTHIAEHVTATEEQEEHDFLVALLKTPIVKRTMKFLQQRQLAPSDFEGQLQLLKNLWFTQYSRGRGHVGSSGFEHVFLAEIREQNILGLHNWIYFSEQEKLGKLDYKGFIDRLDFDKHNNRHLHLLAIRFTLNGLQKSYNTILIGTSPELEISLYTMCFLLNSNVGDPCKVQLGGQKFDIVTNVWDWHGTKTIATAYPSIEK